MESKKILQKMGLNKQESTLYLALLESKPLSVSSIARKTGLHRPTIYRILPALEEKGLTTSIVKKKQKLYTAESPEKLHLLLANTTAEFEVLLPTLKQTFNGAKSNRPIIKYFEGKNGISSIFDDLVHTLKRGDIFYRYSSRIPKNLIEYIPKDYRKIRDQKKLERFVITNEKRYKAYESSPGRALKLIPEEYDQFEYNIAQLIYADKIALIDYNTETAIVIENKTMAEFQKKVFMLLYKKL